MTEKNNQTIYKMFLKSRFFFIFLLPVLGALLFGIFQNLYYRYLIQKDLNKISAEIANLNKQKEELNNLIDYYGNAGNLEKEARLRLNLKKEGEKAVIILPAATTTNETGESISGSGGINLEDLPNYKQWWYFFFK